MSEAPSICAASSVSEVDVEVHNHIENKIEQLKLKINSQETKNDEEKGEILQANTKKDEEEQEEEDNQTHLRIKQKLTQANIPFKELGPHEASLTSNDSARIRQSLGWNLASIHTGAKSMLLKNYRYKHPKSSSNSNPQPIRKKNKTPPKDTQNVTPYVLVVLSAAKKLDWKVIRLHPQIPKAKGLMMASANEVKQVTGCLTGAVPPFSSCFPPYVIPSDKDNNDNDNHAIQQTKEAILSIPVIVDESLLLQGEVIHFNCGLRTHSMEMRTEDYIQLEKPILGQFSL